MRGPGTLLEHEQHWVTAMGAWFPGERVVFRGKDLFSQLNRTSWMELLLYGITGRRFDDRQLRLFEGIWTLCTSYPDPRLWNNRIAALAATARSTAALGIAAATAASEASIFGGRPVIQSIDFLLRARQRLERGEPLDAVVRSELKARRGIAGYGRPLVRTDERIAPVMALAGELGFSQGEYVKLAFDVERVLRAGRWRFRMNVAALLAGLAADQGLSRREYSQYMVLCFSAGMFPGYIEAMHKPEGAFFPLRCARVCCRGKPRRRWEDATDAN